MLANGRYGKSLTLSWGDGGEDTMSDESDESWIRIHTLSFFFRRTFCFGTGRLASHVVLFFQSFTQRNIHGEPDAARCGVVHCVRAVIRDERRRIKYISGFFNPGLFFIRPSPLIFLCSFEREQSVSFWAGWIED